MPLLLPQDNFDTFITTSINESDTEIPVNVLPTKTSGVLTIYDIDGRTVKEKIYYTNISSTPANKITGVVRGLGLVDVAGVVSFASVTGNAQSHPSRVRIAMTDNIHYLGRALSVLNGDEAMGGVMQLPSARNINSARDVTDKEYVDAIAGTAGSISQFMVSKNGSDPTLTVNVGSGFYEYAGTVSFFPGASAQAVANNTTNYVQLNPTNGSIVINALSYLDDHVPLARVVTSGATITSISDDRMFITKDITVAQGEALAGSSGTPNDSNKYLTEDDALQDDIEISQFVQNASIECGMANTTGNENRVAQSFIAVKSRINAIYLDKRANTGTFTGDVTVSIFADSSGSPTGSALFSETIPNATYNGYGTGAFAVTFSPEISDLVPGQLYWIVVSTTTADNSNHPNLGTNSAGGYTDGSVKYNNTADGWVAVPTIDLFFFTVNYMDGRIPRAKSDGTLYAPLIALTATGDIPYRSSTSGEITKLSIGTPGQALAVNDGATAPSYLSALHRVTTKLTATTITDATETSVISGTLKGGYLGTNGYLKVRLLITDLDEDDESDDDLDIRLKIGSTTIVTTQIPNASGVSNNKKGFVEFYIYANNSASAQIGTGEVYVNNGASTSLLSPIISTGTATENTATDKTIEVTAQWASANIHSVTFAAGGFIEVITT